MNKKIVVIVALLVLCASIYLLHNKYKLYPQSNINTNSKIAHLHKAPVEVWYSVKPITVRTLLGSKKVTEITVHFENTGAKRVTFIVNPTFGIYVTDLTGNRYYGRITNETVIIQPGCIKDVNAYFSEKLPQKGWLHVEVIYSNVVIEHIGSETGTSLSEYKGEETVKMKFEIT